MSMPSRVLFGLLLGLFLSGTPARLLANTDAAASADPAPAEEPPAGPVQVALDATVASKYLFQGFDYSDGKAVLQPNLVVSTGSFSAVVWSNFQFDLGEVNEVDLALKYTRSFNRLSISPGYMYLHYPNRDWDPSQEGFVDLGFEGPLSPTLSVHYDFDAGDGVYATLGFSGAVAGSPVSVATNLFYQHHYYGMTGIPTAELKVSTSFPVGRLTVAPSLSRFESFENRDFTGEAQLPASWLFAVNVTPSY